MNGKGCFLFLVIVVLLGLSACEEDSANESESLLIGEVVEQSDVVTNGSEQGEVSDSIEEKASTITIALPSDELHESENKWYDRLVAEINDYVQAEIVWKWYDEDAYSDTMVAAMDSGDLPDVIVTEKSEAFLTAAANGQFWDLAPYIDDFDNFATIPEISQLGASYNGKMYGIPRKGRMLSNVLGYRVDWLEKLQLTPPTDWDSFCEMLYAFTYNDPDGNGVNDTIGLALDSSVERWDAMELWFGAPNEWGIDENGDLIHKSRTQEYRNAYAEFRKLYELGVINNGENGIADFRQVEIYDAINYVNASRAGATIDWIEHYGNVQKVLTEQGITTEENVLFVPQAYVDTGLGAICHTHKKSGMDEMLAISKENIKTEEELRKVLQILNDMSDGYCDVLMCYGWLGETCYITEDNQIAKSTLSGEQVKDGMLTFNYGFREILTDFIAEENMSEMTHKVNRTSAQKIIRKITEENEKYCVPNYGAQYVSETYNEIGETLDAMLLEAEWQYITGEIDDAGFEAALDAWWTIGGEAVTKEKNERLHAARK